MKKVGTACRSFALFDTIGIRTKGLSVSHLRQVAPIGSQRNRRLDVNVGSMLHDDGKPATYVHFRFDRVLIRAQSNFVTSF